MDACGNDRRGDETDGQPIDHAGPSLCSMRSTAPRCFGVTDHSRCTRKRVMRYRLRRVRARTAPFGSASRLHASVDGGAAARLPAFRFPPRASAETSSVSGCQIGLFWLGGLRCPLTPDFPAPVARTERIPNVRVVILTHAHPQGSRRVVDDCTRRRRCRLLFGGREGLWAIRANLRHWPLRSRKMWRTQPALY